jgi:hypothetical protein
MSFTIDKTKVISYPPSALREFQVYGYEWIDNLHFVRPLREFLETPRDYVQVARARFLHAGWDGTGRIGLLWLPPFVFPPKNPVPPEGLVLWHVKQVSDGTSWLLSPVQLPFDEFMGHSTDERLIEKLFPGCKENVATSGPESDGAGNPCP